MMKKTFCDHCGQEITSKNDYTDYSIEFEGGYYDCDLCNYCAKSIIDEIDGRLKEFTGRKKE